MPSEPDESVAEQSAEAPGGDAAPAKATDATPGEANPDQARPEDPAKEAIEDISSLDEQLAAFADDLIAGDLEDSEGSVVGLAAGEGQSASEPDGATGADDIRSADEAETPGEDAPTEPAASETDEPVAGVAHEGGEGEKTGEPAETSEGGEPEASPTAVTTDDDAPIGDRPVAEPQGDEASAAGKGAPAVSAAPAGGSAPPAGKVSGETGPAPVSRAGKARAILATIGRRARPVLVMTARTLSSPLASRPAIVRRIVGLLAIWTTLLAVVMVLMVLTRKAQAPTTSKSPAELHGAMPTHSADSSD